MSHVAHLRITPLENPHSKTTKFDTKGAKKGADVDDILEKIKEKAKQDYIDTKKPRVVKKRNPMISTTKVMANKEEASAEPENEDGAMDTIAKLKAQLGTDEAELIANRATPETEARKLLEDGKIESFVDFVYLTKKTVPSALSSAADFEEINRNGMMEAKFTHGDAYCGMPEEELSWLSATLKQAEQFSNEGEIGKSIEEYKKICEKYRNKGDYATASYFYKKSLIMARQTKFAEGESLSLMGLGLCEEGDKNIGKAQEYYETALEKALDKELHGIVKIISEQLITVYEKMAQSFEEVEDYQKTLDAYDKCLDAAKRALNQKKEAQCYYKLGMTYEKTKEYEKSIENLELYLHICEKLNDPEGKSLALKELAERNKQLGKLEQSKQCLNELKTVQLKDSSKALESQAEAFLKLGLLEFQNGNLQSSVNYFEKEFFENARKLGDRNLVDIGRVNTGIAKGLNSLGVYKDILKNNYYAVLNWKFKRNLNAPGK